MYRKIALRLHLSVWKTGLDMDFSGKAAEKGISTPESHSDGKGTPF